MPGNGHVRFGGRIEETDRWKRRHRASVRPYSWRVFAPRENRRPGQRSGQRLGEVVAVGLPRPGHRVLRHGPHPVRGGAGPARRDRPDNRPTRAAGRRTRGGAAAAGHLQRLLQRLPARGRRPAGWSISTAGPTSAVLRPGRGRRPRPAHRLDRPPGWSGSRTCTSPTTNSGRAGAADRPARDSPGGRPRPRPPGTSTHSLGRGPEGHRPAAHQADGLTGPANPRRRPSPRWTGNGTGWPRTATTR